MREASTTSLTPGAVLPNLDALRFLAFFGVMLAHAYQPLTGLDAVNKAFYKAIDYGVWGVNFFFVLSGFLITRLLLEDTVQHERLRLLRFYKRRVLRIWPLYGVVLIGAGLHYMLIDVPDNNTHWRYYFLFLGNYHILNEGFPHSPALANLWTIAVEEQYYVVAPLLLWLFRKHVWTVAVFLIVVSTAFRLFVQADKYTSNDHLYFNTISVMNDLAVGMLLACFTQRLNANTVRLSTWVQVIVAASLAGLVVWFQFVYEQLWVVAFERIAVAAFFSFVLFQQVFVSNRSFDLQRIPGFNYLGKISYGLYMYHAFAIQLVLLAFEQGRAVPTGFVGMILFPAFVFALTCLAAVTSYEFFEKKILRLKHTWAA
jgi:peptidoglycan/LPS O-acetylase OafA/YrhL